jgi:arylsulfatase A-like enzyme
MTLTRRGLLRRGGATAAGAALAGSAVAPRAAGAQEAGDRGPNVLLVVLPLVRASHVNAFEGDSPADTPNLDDLTGDSLRFDRAIPESMPALPVRRTLVTGMRGFPFRDWRRTDGMPDVPGFNPVWNHQPLMTEVMRAAGVTTLYVTDNPVFAGPRFPEVRRSPGAPTPPEGPPEAGIETELLPSIDRAGEAAARTIRTGIGAIRGLDAEREQPFFLAIDAFDPYDATQVPLVYVKPGEVEEEGIGLMDGRLVELRFSDDARDRVRERYVEHVEGVDRWVGRLMDEVEARDLLENTVVYLLSDHGIALGEHDYLGRAAPTSHRESYEVPYLIRHPGGDMAGDDVDWYASTHDVAPTILSLLGLTIPGKMEGEDLTALFDGVDEEDLPDREKFITAVGSNIVVRDNRWLMVADREEIERRLYDDDEEAGDDDEKRYDDVAGDEPGVLTDFSLIAVAAAGGTLPEFGPDGALRPPAQRGDDDSDDDGIPNDFDAVDNDEPDDDNEPADQRFDGRNP